MIKNILAGISIGISNIIPGVSGGTMIVIFGLFDKLTTAIANIFKKQSKNRFKYIIFLTEIIIGVAIGLIGFANIIDILFKNWPVQTVFAFLGLILFSIPYVVKEELGGIKNLKFNPFIIGGLIIVILIFLNPTEKDFNVIKFPLITLPLLIKLMTVGMIAGASMIFPGISGSMVLLILGEYYLFKSYIADVLTFKLNILIPLFFIGIGIILGVIISAKTMTWLLKKYRKQTMSLILGLILFSSIILIPTDINYNVTIIITSIICFLFGGLIIKGIELLKEEKELD